MIEDNKGGKDTNVLIITDHFTDSSQALVTPSQTAMATAQALLNHFIVHYVLPELILSDQGRNFESTLVKELCQLAQVKKLCTTPYHPQTNGQCEHFNLVLISMQGTLSNENKRNWKEFVPTIVHGYNCMKSTAMDFSPYYLIYGHTSCLLLDLYFGIQTQNLCEQSHMRFIISLESI